MALLERINKANDIKKIPQDSYEELADEIRKFLVEKVSLTGGHLASNLGAVELTMALHIALDLPQDKIVWDVGHQSYTHKLLTGRRKEFDHLRQYGGMSGFPKRKESDCDAEFATGTKVMHTLREKFEPNSKDKYTIVIWLEGNDPDCVDDIIGGTIKLGMDFKITEST